MAIHDQKVLFVMRSNNRTYFFCLVLGLFSHLSLANESSPYQPSFFLSPYQIESDTVFENIRTNYTINSPVLKNSANSINNNYGEKISIGLPNNYSVGISELYVQSLVSNPLNLNAATPGFKNPVFSAAKLWNADDRVLLKLFGSVQPNLGVKAGVSTYNLGASAIYIGPEGWESSISINETTNDAGYGGAPTLSGTISKQSGLYVLNATVAATRFPSILMSGGYAASSYLYAGSLELSRQLTDRAWLGVSYGIGSNQYTYTQNFMKIPFNNRTLYNSVGASLKVLF